MIPADESCRGVGGMSVYVGYLGVDLHNMAGLRDRSTYCNQDVLFTCSYPGDIIHIADMAGWHDYDDNYVPFQDSNIGMVNHLLSNHKLLFEIKVLQLTHQ